VTTTPDGIYKRVNGAWVLLGQGAAPGPDPDPGGGETGGGDPPPAPLGAYPTLADVTARRIGSRIPVADLVPSGTVTTTAHGQVIEGLRFTGSVAINVRHDDVIIRDCYVDWRPTASGQYAIRSQTHPTTGLRPANTEIYNVEVAGRPDLPGVIDAVVAVYLELWRGVYAHHLYVHDVGRGFRYRDDCVLEDSYISANYHQSGSAAHRTAAACDGGARNVIRRNHLECKNQFSSSALSIYNDSRATFDHLIEGNHLVCADGYISYGGCLTSKAFPVADDIRFLNNLFRFEDVNGPLYGGIAAFDAGVRGNVKSGNTWATSWTSDKGIFTPAGASV
jgi:hypothetical protein